jgi:hypothetical protein
MQAHLGLVTVAVGIAAMGCGFAPPSPPPPSPSHRVTAVRSGPSCDTVIARVTSGDTSITVEGPFLLKVVLPPENTPADLRGRPFTIRFDVDVTGRTQVDTLSLPPTNSRRYREGFLKRLKQYTFAPAVAAGCAVPSRQDIRFTF